MGPPAWPERTVSTGIAVECIGVRLKKIPRRTAMGIESRRKAPYVGSGAKDS
jgi:hypothetical protein